MKNRRYNKKQNKVRLIHGKTNSAPRKNAKTTPRKIFLAGTRK